MDVVLGVALASSAPATIHTVLVCGERGDGVTLEELRFDVTPDDATEFPAVDAVIAAILRARDAADTAGHRVVATGVTVTDPIDEAELNARLSTGGLAGLANVALISPVLAAASLAHNLGQMVGCERMGLLSVESRTATLAMVDCTDGAITQILRQPIDNGDAATAFDTFTDRLNAPQTCPDGLYLLCSDGDPTVLRPQLETTVGHEVCEPTEPRSALARGAALASARLTDANTPCVAQAYTDEPPSGEFQHCYYDIPGGIPGFDADDLAYSAIADEDAEAATEIFGPAGHPPRRPMLVAGAALASAAFAAASALMVAMTLDISPSLVALRPDLGRALTIPHRTPNLQVPGADPFGGQPPVMGPAPSASLPLPPLSVPLGSDSPTLDLPPLDLPTSGPLVDPAPGLPAVVPLAATVGAATAPLFIPAPMFGPPMPGQAPSPAHAPFILGPAFHPAPRRPVVSALPDFAFLLGFPGKKPPAPVVKPQPPEVKPEPGVVIPKPPLELPDLPIVKPDLPIVKPIPPVITPHPPLEIPHPPVVTPHPPIVKPTPPIVKPNPPVQLPDPPVVKPTPPIVKPNPPVVAPHPPITLPDPPIHVPDAPIHVPDVPIHVPEAPIRLPEAPVGLPDMPIKLPDAPIHVPETPIHVPNLPIQPPNSAPPIGLPTLPVPNAPTFPGLPSIPAPSAPVIPAAPSMPAFSPPALPSLPAPHAPALPAFPVPQAPALPSLPMPHAPALPSLPMPHAPALPSLPMPHAPAMPAPSMPSLPKLGGGMFGGGGKPGGIFGGGGKPGGIFGGGGSRGGGLFGGGGRGLFGGGGRGLFGH